MLNELDHIPEGLLSLPASRLHELLDGPTLIHLEGRDPTPVFISALLHGNEDSGWEAMRALLLQYQNSPLPRSLSLFIGNVAAAKDAARHLEGQHDYNRIWSRGESTEHQMAAKIVEIMQQRKLFASIDIHNNTGLNPHYACVNALEPKFFHLATLFSRTVVYFIQPAEVQSIAFSFNDPKTDILFSKDMEHFNFRELPPLTPLAHLPNGRGYLEAWNEAGDEVADRLFENIDNRLYTRLALMPSMLTMDEQIIRQDCLCYLMERVPAIDWSES